MKFTEPKFISFIDGKLYFDLIIEDGDSKIPYTYLDNDNPESVIDKAIKGALENGELVVDTTIITECGKNCNEEKSESDIWSIRNSMYQKFRNEYYEILRMSYIEYKEHLFYIGDLNIFNSYFIINRKTQYIDVQNDKIELNQNDFKNLIDLSLSKKVMIMKEYSRIKNQLSEANTIEELNNIEWDLE